MRGAAGFERAALAMLQTMGAGSVELVLPQPGAAGSQAGLGIAAPVAAEVTLEPVLVRASANGEVLSAVVCGSSVRRVLSQMLVPDAGELAVRQTLEAAMLRVEGTQYRITAVTTKWYGGTALLYELRIEV
jgi:hypothetical protein